MPSLSVPRSRRFHYFMLLFVVGVLLVSLPASAAAQDAQCPSWAFMVSYGDTHTGEITNKDPLVAYCLNGTAGDAVVISATAISGNLDTYLFLSDVDADEIFASNDDMETGVTDSQIVFTLPETRVYMISVTRYQLTDGTTTGRFELEVIREDVALEEKCPPAGKNIAYGENATSEITNINWAEFYCFAGEEGDEVTIEMVTTSGNLDTFLVLSDVGFTQEYTSNDDISTSDRNSRIEYTLPHSGLYLISATRYDLESGTTTGGFRLSVDAEVEETVVVPPPKGTPRQGTDDDAEEVVVDLDCDAEPLSQLVRGTWVLSGDGADLSMDFRCDGIVRIVIGSDAPMTSSYTFVNDVIAIRVQGSEPLRLIGVILTTNLMMATYEATDQLVLFLNSDLVDAEASK